MQHTKISFSIDFIVENKDLNAEILKLQEIIDSKNRGVVTTSISTSSF